MDAGALEIMFKALATVFGIVISIGIVRLAFAAGSVVREVAYLRTEVSNLREDVTEQGKSLRREVESNSDALNGFALDMRSQIQSNEGRITLVEKKMDWDGNERREREQREQNMGRRSGDRHGRHTEDSK